ncbi:MAG: transposase, partial [Methylocystaceae bacterium]
MPRKPRIWFPGAIYHITCRGNHQSDIFRDDTDRFELLNILDETQHKFPYKLHGYCFMSNHVHLHIETIDVNIGQIMKKINMSYAMHFNYRYQFIGHLFQDRYRAELIDSDEYNLTASRYIHLNPVRANIVEKPIDYQ